MDGVTEPTQAAAAADAPIVDFHNHVLPGVDDGARDPEQGVAALRAFREQSVGTVIATPHLDASITERSALLEGRLAAFDAALEALEEALAGSELGGAEPALRLERGVELKLDAPEPQLGDPRIRLAGTRFVLVEFPAFQMPPYGARQLAAIRDEGWVPVLAHPERYAGVADALDRAAGWREAGAYFQLNGGSLVGYYGPQVEEAAWGLLEAGWVDYLSSDYHARGVPDVRAACSAIQRTAAVADGREVEDVEPHAAEAEPGGAKAESDGASVREAAVRRVVRLLTESNPARLLRGLEPQSVPPLARKPRSRRRGLGQFFS